MSPIAFPEIRFPHLERIPLPPVARVRLRHPKGNPIRDPKAAVHGALSASSRLKRLEPGARVALAVGSRGIARLSDVVQAAVAYLKEHGLEPFVVPAMGSHGAGTAEGQEALLDKLGVSEATVGAPVRASMETVVLGRTREGIPCHFDRHAAEADAVVVINRVKSHTSFPREIESGLTKMAAVGLGKAEGARNVHRLGARGYHEVLPALARIALDKAPIACGIALVENADKELVVVEGVEPRHFAAIDARLLKLAKSLLAKLPFRRLDALVVEEVGKNISGAGMDYLVVGRTDMRGLPNPEEPFIHKIAALGLTEATRGNGIGLGVADYTTRRVAESLDLEAMYLNAITATFIEKARIPVVLADDRQAIQAALATSWRLDPENARLAIIRSTLHLDEILVSPPLLAELEDSPRAERVSDAEPLQFDGEGSLLTRV